MKNIKIIALLVMTLVVVLACFTSCETLQQIPGINQIPGIKPEEPVHEHSYENGKCECGELEPGYSCLEHTWSEEITLGAEPTCTEDGYNLVTCTVCGYQRKTPIFRLGHNYTDEQTFVIAGTCEKKGSITKICTRCSESDITETPMHPNTDIAYGYAPTCLDDGMYTRMECPDCGKMWGDQACTQEVTLEQVTIPATGHQNIVHNEAVEAACHQNGNIEHWICMDCGFAWLDEECTLNTNVLSVILPHTAEIVDVAATEANCHQDGNVAYSYCAECFYAWTVDEEGNKMTTTFKDVVLLHTAEIVHVEGAPACHVDGIKEHWYCAECEYVWTVDEEGNQMTSNFKDVIIPATLTLTHVEAVDPTCGANGHQEYWYCEDCEGVYSDAEGRYLTNRMNLVLVATGDHTVEVLPAVEPTCLKTGLTEGKKCTVCGEVLVAQEERAALGHIDENLDVECDRDGCTYKVAPKADSVLSTYTANCLGSKLSTENKYYVVGTIVEVLDQRNGIFLVDDGTGEKFYFRLPVNAEGVSHANWEVKLTLGDKVQIYGKINKFTASTAPNGQYWPAMQSPVVTLLEQHPHDFTFSAADCTDPARCVCGQSYGDPRGCVDTNGDSLCDDCGKNANYKYEYVEIRTDNNSGVRDEAAGTVTWGNDNFDVQVVKGTSTQLYSTAKDHMRVYKGNQFVLASKNGIKIKTIIVYLTNATQVGYFEKFLTGYTYTKDEEKFTVTVEIDSVEKLTFINSGSTTQIKGVEFGYEK